MSRRIDVELTSARDDGTWTWRAAGAKQPKGVLEGGLLYSGAKVGDVVRAEVETDLDGMRVLQVTAPKGSRREPERLTLLGRGEPDQLVTSTLVGKRGRSDRGDRDRGDRDRGDRGDRGRRPGGPRGDRPRGDGPGGDRPGGDRGRRPGSEAGGGAPRSGADRGDRSDRPSRPRRERPAPEPKPRSKRLRPGRVHRKAVLEGLPPEQQPIAEHVLRGGIPAVRQAVEKQNEAARAEGRPEVPADALVAMAEQLLPGLRTAEWRDRAEAALSDLDELDLRDLRSVVAAADTAGKDDESRALAAKLREGLGARVEQEQAAWLQELTSTLADGRVVRALRLSSRPPKAGARLPADITARLTEATSAALTADTAEDRWATVLDALSFSPVHLAVIPASSPEKVGDDLLAAVRKASARLPQIAAMFGVEPAPVSPAGRRPPRSRGKSGGGAGKGGGPKPGQGRAAPGGASSGGRPVPPPPPKPASSDAPPATTDPGAPAAEAETPASSDAPPVTDPASPAAPADAPASSDTAPVPEPAPPASAPETPPAVDASVRSEVAPAPARQAPREAGLMEAAVPPVTEPASPAAPADAPASSDTAPVPEPAPPASAPETPHHAGPTDAVTAPAADDLSEPAQDAGATPADAQASDDSAPAPEPTPQALEPEPTPQASAPEATRDR